MVEDRRLIIFLELVNGCMNSSCPSWNVVCKQTKQSYMSKETLIQSCKQIKDVLKNNDLFKIVDLWTYGNGDSLDHPEFYEMIKIIRDEIGEYGKISTAIDSRREILPGNWYKLFDKIKIIHKLPHTFDWISRAKLWSEVPVSMSHKLITNRITKEMWNIWKSGCYITELKAVPWHNIVLGTDSPVFLQREKFTWEDDIPIEYGPYPGIPVRRSLVTWNGKLRRCLVSPTKYQNIKDLFLECDDICQECFPLTGSELCKFYSDKIVITPSANCVSDGYFKPYPEPIDL